MSGDASDPTEVRLHGFSTARDPERINARDHLEVVASRFADEVRRGLYPSVEDYALRYPAFAEEIRELFPMVAGLERWKIEKEEECVRQNLPAELPFRQLGSWKLVREIGRGGMGVVFEAVGRQGKRAAVKLLPWRFTADVARRKEQLRQEANTIARLRHRNIVPVYSFGEHEGYSYYVMQLVDGVTLAWLIRRLRESPEPVTIPEIGSGAVPEEQSEAEPVGFFPLSRDDWAKFAKIALQVALALDYAHHHQVLHHDVKPGNLLLDAAGQILLSDFGVGVPRADRSVETISGMGTLRYMAPERLVGPGDARSDVYSLGVTLFELATLQPAFHSVERGALIDEIQRGRVPQPRDVRKDIPRDLETIILCAMSRDPDDRFASVRRMATDLLRFSNGEAIETRRPGILRAAVRHYIRRFGSSGHRPSP